MWRHLIRPREGWVDTVKSTGLVYPETPVPDSETSEVRPYWNEAAWYEVTSDEVETIETATEELYQMCLAAVKVMVSGERFTDEELALPAGSLELARKSFQRGDPSLYARFDLAIVDGVPKMLEINGDTPTGVVETAVTQWMWLEEQFPDSDQFNSLWDRLVNRWKFLQASGFIQDDIHFFNCESETSGEEEMTVACLRDTALHAGLATYGNTIEQVGWDTETKGFVDWGDKPIHTAFKLYPWEDMLREDFGKKIMAGDEKKPVQWIEPAWKLMMSTKALLVVLWELYPNHPNLLPAYYGEPKDLLEWVSKPLQGREGDNVVVHSITGDEFVNEGGYGDQPMVYQERVELPNYDGNYLVVGSWIVGESSAGILMRESDGPVTDYFSRVVPHCIAMESRPDAETVQKWLSE